MAVAAAASLSPPPKPTPTEVRFATHRHYYSVALRHTGLGRPRASTVVTAPPQAHANAVFPAHIYISYVRAAAAFP